MTATATPLSGKILDALTWIGDGKVRSAYPADDAPIRVHHTSLSQRTVTKLVTPAATAGLARRANGGVQWHLTAAGRAALDAATVYVVADENAIVDRAGRRGTDWWHDYSRTSPAIVRHDDGTLWIPCAGTGAAQRLVDLMTAASVPRRALRIQEAS